MNITGEASLTNVTFAENLSGLASGGAISNEGATTLLILKNVIVGNSVQSTNCAFTQPPLVSEFNLSSDNSCTFGGGRDNVDLKLGALANNGGSTQTHLPLAGSPAIDGGDNSNCPSHDQRGVVRPQGSKCDVGAAEVGGTPPCTTKPDKPVLKKPAHNKPISKPTAKLKWQNANCAEKYKVIIRLGAPGGATFQQKGKLASTQFVTKTLVKGKTYFWRAVAMNEHGKSKSDWRTFTSK
jgi:predicted outer membrane repeat protein